MRDRRNVRQGLRFMLIGSPQAQRAHAPGHRWGRWLRVGAVDSSDSATERLSEAVRAVLENRRNHRQGRPFMLVRTGHWLGLDTSGDWTLTGTGH